MKQIHIDIHKAVHNPDIKKIKINGIPYDIRNVPNSTLRHVKFMDDGKEWEIVQQNPNTRSTYALRAKDGEKISWLIPLYVGYRKRDGWKVITDSTPIEEKQGA